MLSRAMASSSEPASFSARALSTTQGLIAIRTDLRGVGRTAALKLLPDDSEEERARDARQVRVDLMGWRFVEVDEFVFEEVGGDRPFGVLRCVGIVVV